MQTAKRNVGSIFMIHVPAFIHVHSPVLHEPVLLTLEFAVAHNQSGVINAFIPAIWAIENATFVGKENPYGVHANGDGAHGCYSQLQGRLVALLHIHVGGDRGSHISALKGTVVGLQEQETGNQCSRCEENKQEDQWQKDEARN